MEHSNDIKQQLYFNLKIEMQREVINETIARCIETKGKGYVCCLEANNVTVANKVDRMRESVNHALVNTCDGSNVAMVLGLIHRQKFHSYVGADLFRHHIDKKCYRHLFLGNTPEVLDSMKANLLNIDNRIEGMKFLSLPFREVDEFDYAEIGRIINADHPDIVWVSLGAPKQEIFMAKLLPFLDRGVMMGVGAVFNFYSNVGGVTRAPKWMQNLHLEWLHRAIEQPKKNIPRYWRFIKILPKLIRNEYQSLQH